MQDDQFSRVYEFNQSIIGIDRPYIGHLADAEFSWLEGALHEEIDELVAARADSVSTNASLAGQIDALVDLAYFAIGGLVRLGVNIADARIIFDTVHRANMSKVRGAKVGRAVSLDLDAAKPMGWTSPDEIIRGIVEAGSVHEAI